MFEGTSHPLGYFHREENAARAYNTAAVRFYGDKANLNKLDDPQSSDAHFVDVYHI